MGVAGWMKGGAVLAVAAAAALVTGCAATTATTQGRPLAQETAPRAVLAAAVPDHVDEGFVASLDAIPARHAKHERPRHHQFERGFSPARKHEHDRAQRFAATPTPIPSPR